MFAHFVNYCIDQVTWPLDRVFLCYDVCAHDFNRGPKILQLPKQTFVASLDHWVMNPVRKRPAYLCKKSFFRNLDRYWDCLLFNLNFYVVFLGVNFRFSRCKLAFSKPTGSQLHTPHSTLRLCRSFFHSCKRLQNRKCPWKFTGKSVLHIVIVQLLFTFIICHYQMLGKWCVFWGFFHIN